MGRALGIWGFGTWEGFSFPFLFPFPSLDLPLKLKCSLSYKPTKQLHRQNYGDRRNARHKCLHHEHVAFGKSQEKLVKGKWTGCRYCIGVEEAGHRGGGISIQQVSFKPAQLLYRSQVFSQWREVGDRKMSRLSAILGYFKGTRSSLLEQWPGRGACTLGQVHSVL